MELNGEPATFVLDTGATNTAVSREFAERIGLKGTTLHLDSPAEAGAPAAALESQFATPQSLSVGPIRAKRNSGHVLIMDLANVCAIAGEVVDGILGNATLASADFSLNVRQPGLQLSRDLGLSRVDEAQALRTSGYRMYLPVEINGHTFDFLLDTGSNISFVTSDLLSTLGVVESDFVTLSNVTVTSAQTRTFQRIRATARIGQVVVREFPLLVGEANLLGLDLLRHGQLSVSVRHQKFVFRSVEGE